MVLLSSPLARSASNCAIDAAEIGIAPDFNSRTLSNRRTS